jgi:hypothetical protein
MDRWMMLQFILQQQMTIMQASPLNPLVSPMEMRNTYEDALLIAGMRNSARYFKPCGPAEVQQFMQAIQQKENPEMVYAKAEADKVRAQVIKILTDARVNVEDMTQKDDRDRDKTEGDQMLKAAEIDARYGAQVDTAAIRTLWAAPRTPPSGGGASSASGVGEAGLPPSTPPTPDQLPTLPARTSMGAGPPQLSKGGMPAGLLDGGSPFTGATGAG